MTKKAEQSFIQYQRRFTNTVTIGELPLGAEYPVRVQSMTNTPTHNAKATADQIVKIRQAGADLARVTVPARRDAENLNAIRDEVIRQVGPVPLVADIHFNPQLAFLAAAVVDKVRINPGNFVDRKLSKTVNYTAEQYQEELMRLREKFVELLNICKLHNTALRVGTNHGSLSDRIMSRFGDTPEGMAESAMEFLRICREENFDQVLVSMKASNTRIMVHATRLLLEKMMEEDMHYPLHLGVTEAGEGEDGRIKSAVGIGTLMADGIGDTIRVSLTEDPELEIPVAQKMVDYLKTWENHAPIPDFGKLPIELTAYRKRKTTPVAMVGGDNPPAVFYALKEAVSIDALKKIGWYYSANAGWTFSDLSPDMLLADSWPDEIPLPDEKQVIHKNSNGNKNHILPLFSWDEFTKNGPNQQKYLAIEILASELNDEKINLICKNPQALLVLKTNNINGFADQRAAIFRLMNAGCNNPLILKRSYTETQSEDFQLKASIDLGGLFIDGLAEGIWLEDQISGNPKLSIETAFGILQASRVRISKTEYISCPSCGRTLFDLQSTTKKIRKRTAHLKGLKIGIMGCIVNGPGEMADADYGYVGTGKGNVTLYKEKEVVKKNVPEADAVDELINLLKENGDWVDP